jgi:Fe-S-cluster containining protein
MSHKKFKGKIHDDPWEALSKGPREVMASLWQQYLAEVLGLSPKGRRFELLRREIEKAAGFKEIFENWNELAVESRGAAWRRLMTATREKIQAVAESCVRCGECCEKGSPTLLTADLDLLHREVLTFNDVYTLRAGEKVTDREGQVVPLEGERLKVREVPGSHQCWFYLAATQTCRIYDDRPEQCRRQNCWADPARPPAVAQLLTRRQVLEGVPEIWELISEHEERCNYAALARALKDVAAGKEEAGDILFEALHFDHYLREMLLREWEMTPAAVELLLGRPLPEFFEKQGLRAILTPEGVYRLEPRDEAHKD